MQVSNYQLSLKGATIVDVNPSYTQDSLPDRLPDELAVTNSMLFNLLNCAPGERGRIFNPAFGSLWKYFIDEPINDFTSNKMQVFMIQSIEKWIPDLTVDTQNTRIVADLSIPGYLVTIVCFSPFAQATVQATFNLEV